MRVSRIGEREKESRIGDDHRRDFRASDCVRGRLYVADQTGRTGGATDERSQGGGRVGTAPVTALVVGLEDSLTSPVAAASAQMPDRMDTFNARSPRRDNRPASHSRGNGFVLPLARAGWARGRQAGAARCHSRPQRLRPRFGRAGCLPIHHGECAAPRGSWRSPSWGAGRWGGSFTCAAPAVDRQLDAELAAALDRGGIADLGRAQAVGRRLALGAGGGRSEAAALAFADARLATDYGASTAPEAEEILARFGLPDGRSDGASTMAASAKALLTARNGDREGAARIAAAAAAAQPGSPYPLYALGRARAPGRRSRGGRAGVRGGERRRAGVSRLPRGARRGSARPRQRRPRARCCSPPRSPIRPAIRAPSS